MDQTKECFSLFGLAVYLAQTIEKSVMLVDAASNENITKTRYDEILYEKSNLVFGKLLTSVKDKLLFDLETLNKLDYFLEKRNLLIHHYWWDRCVEFYSDELRYKIIEELNEIISSFESINDIVEEKLTDIMVKKGVDPDSTFSEFAQLKETPTLPKFNSIKKDVTLIGIYTYKPSENSEIPIFKFEDGSYYSLCEVGLSNYLNLIEDKLVIIEKTKEIFPVKQFNPKPKISETGEYVLDLKKNGFIMKVKPTTIEGSFYYKWGIFKKTS